MAICPVCGYPELDEHPRTDEGGGSYEICPCCNFQFGVTDDDEHISYSQWRERWIKSGMIWDEGNSEPSQSWNPRKQLENLAKLPK